MRKYEIDQLSQFWKGIHKDKSYIVTMIAPECIIEGPLRILAETATQARVWKNRISITKISMWPHNPFKERKKKAVKIVPNPISWEELPGLLMSWNSIFLKSIMK